MAGGLVFDAASSNPDGTNPGTALDVYNTASYQVLLDGISWPAPAATIQWASSVDTEGALSASAKHENRQIGMTILCKTAAALTDLETKLMKIHREGGTLKWTLRDGTTTIIFDLLSLDTYEPVFDDGLHVKSSGTLTKVRISMTAKPYGRGVEVTLSDHVETTLPLLVFTETGIKGDIPGLGRLVVDNDAALTQEVLVWGIQSRYYSSASTAALFFQAESLTSGGAGASTAAVGTASGGSVMRVTSNTGFFFSPNAGATAWTHIGTFRVLARVLAANTNTGTVSAWLQWQPTPGAAVINNDLVPIVTGTPTATPLEGTWVWADLGLVTLPKATTGDQAWQATFEVSGNGTDTLDWDCIALIPADEGSGIAQDNNDVLGSNATSAKSCQITYREIASLVGVTGGNFYRRPRYEGDYLTVPTAGAEARTLRVIVLLGDTEPAMTGQPFWDTSIDDLSAQLFYTPRYLVVPST